MPQNAFLPQLTTLLCYFVRLQLYTQLHLPITTAPRVTYSEARRLSLQVKLVHPPSLVSLYSAPPVLPPPETCC